LNKCNYCKEKGLYFICGKFEYIMRDCENNIIKNKISKGKKIWKKKNKQMFITFKDNKDVRHVKVAFKKINFWKIVKLIASNIMTIFKYEISL